MATVRINSNIRYHVHQQLSKLFQQRIENERAKLQELNLGRLCYEHHFSKAERDAAEILADAKPKPWVTREGTIPLTLEYIRNNGSTASERFTVNIDPTVILPDYVGQYSSSIPIEKNMPIYPTVVGIFETIDSLIIERDLLIKTMVHEVLEKCGTLRQVLELWPNAMDYMPDDVRQQHNAVQPKRVVAANDIVIDDSVKIALLKAQMINSGS